MKKNGNYDSGGNRGTQENFEVGQTRGWGLLSQFRRQGAGSVLVPAVVTGFIG